MSTNYLDTLTMFYPCPFDIRHLFNIHWIHDTKEQDYNFHHFCVKTDYAFWRFYYDMYGFRRLYFTCSLPKFYHQCNNNTYNITDYDNPTFMNLLYSELGKALDISQLPMTLADWHPSRIDLFRMRQINPVDRLEYRHGYGRLMYRGVKTSTYKNTNYLPSSMHSKQPCVLLRNYNKTIEIQNKQSLLYGNLPQIVEEEHEKLMLDMDIPNDLYRYEFSLRRNYLIRYCDRYNLPLNMENIMDENFQKRLLNELVISRGLHYHILNKNDYRKIVSVIFHWQQTKDNALKLAESIRNKRPIPLKKHQQYRIQHELNSYFISTATTNFVSIRGLNLLH